MCIITADGVVARKLQQDLEEFYDNVLLFPEKDLIFYDIEASFKDITAQRLQVLQQLTVNKENTVVITTINALLQPTLPVDQYKQGLISFQVGDIYELDDLAQRLVQLGYSREEIVEGKGQFAVRGGILDFFSQGDENACRIEFFGDEVDSIRAFDVLTQRSMDKLDSAMITPSAEIILTPETRMNLIDLLKTEDVTPELKQHINRDAERFLTNTSFPSIDKYIPTIYPQIPTLADYLTDHIVFFCEPKRISEAVGASQFELEETIKNALDKQILMAQKGFYRHDYHGMVKRLTKQKLIGISGISHTCPDYRPKEIASIVSKTQTPFHGNPELFYEGVQYYQHSRYRTIILAGSAQKAEHIAKTLLDKNIIASFKEELNALPEMGEVYVLGGELNKGFEYPLISSVVISDKEIFGSHRARPHKRAPKRNQQRIMSYSDLAVGDYVVHQNHGIGQFVGMKQLTVDGASNDYLQIKYSGEDSLYIPATQLDMVYKYIGKESDKVRLNKLGGTDWTKTKQKVKAACKDMAEQLIKLYAARETIPGHAFSPDNEWQRQFEDSFPYDETEDQIRSINEVKSDMEKPKPMDRLLCGDVGYGKTEVALRAAFKAVADGYQVAYLVPTTILANQHYHTFVQRMASFPMTVEMMSRFRTPKQQKDIIRRTKSGDVDVVIGTHRILQEDLQFKKLGLLIIDEEQRFGVGHKEKMKELKSSVDVLTLTATPIPRTLHMSLIGIRDMSVIEQPPKDRYPVATYVLEYDFDILGEAILREVTRGGQVYYLHNRVQTIYKTANKIQQISPDLRVAVAHGKMNENELEDIMQRVIDHEIDVLVCTTIIETGLDISNINTIIIEDADRMGLSQLYQLRGRVGRSNKMAYAYLTYRRDKILNEIAEKRLRAVKEFTEFGSGFKIALRDLEIRGAGNVIGAQQHGHMDAVGYDLFCKLLAEAVSEEKGESFAPQVQATINLPFDAYIPKSYIKGENYRIEMYKRIASIENQQDADDVYEEIEDRYGDLPESVQNLINISLIRAEASILQINELTIKNNNVIFMFQENAQINFNAISALMAEMKGKLLFSAAVKPYLTYRCDNKNTIVNIKNMLRKFKQLNFQSN